VQSIVIEKMRHHAAKIVTSPERRKVIGTSDKISQISASQERYFLKNFRPGTY